MRYLRFLRRKVIRSLPALLALTLLAMGVGQPGWAAVETVKAFGLVESGILTEATTFNDASVVYVRVNVGVQAGGSYANVTITDDAAGGNTITITVYDNGYLPDDDNNDTYYWGKFTLRQGDGTGTSDVNDILELSDGETATISADLDSVGGPGTKQITAGYSTFTDFTPPVMTLSADPSTFSPDGDGVQDTTTISFTLSDNVSTSLYARLEIRDNTGNHVIKRNLVTPSDGALTTGSHSYVWNGKDDAGSYVPDETYMAYLISVDGAENSAQRTVEIVVETIDPEITDVSVNPSTISPQNGDGNYDTSITTFKATNAGADLTFKVYADSACTPPMVRDLTSLIQPVAGNDHFSVTWDGKNDSASYVDDGGYTCKIYAKSLTDEEDENTDGTVTVDNTAPSAVTNLSASAVAGGDIELSWNASSSPDADQYNIYRATSSGGQSYASPTYTVAVGTNTYTDTSTSDGVTYYYVVRTQDTVANIETNTTEVSATASAAGPSFSSITSEQTVYKNGDTITLTVTLDNNNTGCTVTADFSNIDSQYVTGGEVVVNWGTDGVDNNSDGHIDEPAEQGIYVVSYLISLVNTRADGSHSVPVTATDAASNSASSSISLTLDNTAPSAPTNLSATALSAGGIELSWTASSPETDVSQYNIYRATSSGGQNYSTPTYTVSSGTTTYTDTSTTNGVTYYYVVRAQDNVNNIETNTNEASATAGVTEAPSFSSITADSSGYKDGDTIELMVTLANHNTGCTLRADFSNIDSQYVTGGEVVVNWGTDGKDNDGDGHTDGPSEQGVYVISYLISTVNTKADGSYSVPVTATDAATNSASSSISLTLDNTAPPAPTGLTASAIVGGSIQVSWTRSSPETDVSQYNIYRATSSGGQNYSSPTYTVSAGTSSYTDTSTSNGQTYYYVVRAQDTVGNIEANTNEVSATSSGSGPPAPTGLTATAIAGGSIQLNWTLSSPETDVAQYNIYRALNSEEQNYASPLANVSAGTSTYTDTTTTDGVTYYYVVRAQDAVGNSESNTNEASAVADATAPPAPTNLVATTFVGSGIQLGWNRSSPETDVSQYNIYRASSSGGQNYSSPTYSVSAGNIGYTDTSVSDGATYYYVVRAQDAAGNIETNTNETSATVDLSGPSVNVSDIYLKYEEELLYNLASSSDSGVPTVFARGKVDEVYLRLNLIGGFELNKTSSSIILFRGIGDDAEEVTGSKEIKEGPGWAEFIFHIDPPFDPDVDEHSRDALYWVDVFVVSTTDTINDFDFYFFYDTTSPAVPDFGITSLTPSSGTISVSGKTWPDSSDPQQVEIFLNSTSQGVVTADGAGNFSKDNLVLAAGDNYIAVQSTDRAGNKSELSDFSRQRYNPQSLFSIVIRSSHVVKSGSATIPVEIIYAVTEPAQVTIHIHNLLGETVKEWSQWVNPGEEPEWSWLGENIYGETVNNGVYIIKVIADNGSGRKENVTKLLGVLR